MITYQPSQKPGLGDLIRRRARAVAKSGRLCVCVDFDGTISQLVSNRSEARALDGCKDALEDLAMMPDTTVAIISGRSLTDLAERSAMSDRVRLFGSHGLETGSAWATALPTSALRRLATLRGQLAGLSLRFEGVDVELKPASAAVHFRNATPQVAEQAVAFLRTTIDGWPGFFRQPGHAVIEYSVVKPDKGSAVAALRRSLGGNSVVYIGDDFTDEAAFRVLSPNDLSVKVGPGLTSAQFRVGDPSDVEQLLEYLLGQRKAWMERPRRSSVGSQALTGRPR